MANFVEQYLIYNQGNMVPKRYHAWSALSILAMTMGRKVFVDHSYFQVYTMLYSCLVGRQGLRKSSAKDCACDMLKSVFPGYPLGASVTSREKIVERLSGDKSTVLTFTDHDGILVPYKPMAFFINELKNFLSINPGAMIEFLTDIYDRKFFDADTIKHGAQPIINPCINILACETPKWLIEKLKLNVVTGGFSRRMLYIYETAKPKRITFPHKNEESLRAEAWCKQHLQKIDALVGPFSWKDQVARDFFDNWFTNLKTPDDEILEGFYEAKDILALKVTMLLCVADEQPELILTKEKLEMGIAFLEQLEDNLPKLTVAAGRNELAVPQQAMLDILEEKGGMMAEKEWHKLAGKNMSEFEYANAKKFFKDTDQLYEINMPIKNELNMKVDRRMMLTAAKYRDLIKSGDIGVKQPTP